jgi:pimeloyl-ACP methyl ester carboxylesterase
VILVTGSGPQDRDEDLGLGIKPFRLIADYLTRRGIAVLRYDDRGVGKSTGNFDTATTVDFASDAAAAFDYLLTRKDVQANQIGLLGHSEGGMVASILIGQGKKPFAFIVSMAGPGAPIADLMLKQNEKVLRTTTPKPDEAEITAQLDYLKKAYPLILSKDDAALETLTAEFARATYKAMTDTERKQSGATDEQSYVSKALDGLKPFHSPWWAYFLAYDPRPDWAKATMPVLGVFGGLDVQVDAEQNASALEAALKRAGNKDYKIVILPDANHLMQAATTGGVAEYATLKQEFTAAFLPTVGDWIVAHVTIAK